MVDVIIAMGIGVLIGAFGVIAWALSAAKKDEKKNSEREVEINENQNTK